MGPASLFRGAAVRRLSAHTAGAAICGGASGRRPALLADRLRSLVRNPGSPPRSPAQRRELCPRQAALRDRDAAHSDPHSGRDQRLDFKQRVGAVELLANHELRDIIDRRSAHGAALIAAVVRVAVDHGLHMVEPVNRIREASGPEILENLQRFALERLHDR